MTDNEDEKDFEMVNAESIKFYSNFFHPEDGRNFEIMNVV